ncbi:biotin--[acetyl-CoA-carboxylase] ligase [Flavobacterium ardleyense]|uniref:Biotin--[acetyl-CoA-carboxylase] ligase n=1 Tax=Flavobacterium ardleyense TaxID=2038737 RepID=A0ABW5Z558_9FLAO
MNLIKLSAIDSTNTFLKKLASSEKVENFTTVVAEHQTDGKGQRGANWTIEPGKNLTFSVLYLNDSGLNSCLFTLNVIVALSVVEGLQMQSNLKFNIKWPNDILSENKKIAGILIENTLKSQTQIQSIIGIGVNVNQELFENLPQASSLFLLEQKKIDKDLLLKNIVDRLEYNLKELNEFEEVYFWEEYHSYLYKRDIVSTFQGALGQRFVGKIIKVTSEGKLKVLLEDDSEVDFDIKEVKMLY